MNQPKNKKPAALASGGSDRTEPGQGGVIATPQCPTVPPDSQPDFLRAALWYASQGWHVFPCRPGGKEPIIPGGCTAATTAEPIIRGWWEHCPDANIGVHPAPSGLVVLDVDAKNGGEGLKSWNALRERLGAEVLDNTVMARTPSGGLHVYYQKTAVYIRNATEANSPLGPGISVRVSGYYVVAPPSRTPAGGYSWQPGKSPRDRKPAPLPEGLAALLSGEKSREKREVSRPAHNHSTQPTHSSPIPEGERDNTLTSLAGSMRRRGMTREEIEAALLTVNSNRCDPPLPEERVRQIAASVGRYPPEVATAAAGATGREDESGDYGHAKALHALGFGEHFRWATHRGAWMRWTDQVWRAVSEQVVVKQASDELRLHYATLLMTASEKETIRELTRKINEARDYAPMVKALSFLRGFPGVEARPEEWDRDPWLLNVKNGTLDLRNFTLRPHNPNDMLTQLAPVDYDVTTTCPQWLSHLVTFVPDPEILRQIHRDIGCSLVGASLEQILPIWWGTGGNGKSTTLAVIRSILGDYAKMAAPKLLMLSKHERHPSELADLCGCRVLFAVETTGGARLDEERAKALSGGENIKARYMGRDFFEFPRTWTIFLVTNHKPQIRGTDNAIWRRIRLVPWTVSLPKDRQRPQEEVIRELMKEAPAILAWMVEGLRDWLHDRKWVASAVSAATEQYQAEQDIIGPFLADCCELGPRYSVAAAELYETYLDWCGRNSEEPLSKDRFSKQLFERGFSKKRLGHSGARGWGGLRLKKAGGDAAPGGAKTQEEEPPLELIIPDSAAGGGG